MAKPVKSFFPDSSPKMRKSSRSTPKDAFLAGCMKRAITRSVRDERGWRGGANVGGPCGAPAHLCLPQRSDYPEMVSSGQ